MKKRNYFLSPLSILLLLSVFFTQQVKAQNYCASKGNLPWQEWIANVQFGTINNTSSKEGYGNFTSQTTTVTKGTSYPLSILQGFSWAADPTNQTQQGKVWIDYNQNGTFEASELVASLTRTTATANITIPQTALTGATRMRVSLKTTGAPTACETFDKGEVEDYSVNITGSTGTGQPDLTFSNITVPTSVKINEPLNISCRFKNIGTGEALSPFESYAYVQLNKSGFGTYTYPIYIYRSGGIPVGFDSVYTSSSIVTTNLPAGDYTLRFVADPDSRITESNENNNIFEIPLTILPATTDNSFLKVTTVTGPTTANPSSTLPLSITIKNEGTLSSAPDSVFYATWRRACFVCGSYASNYALNRVAVPSIAAGATVTVNANFILPATLKTTIVNDFQTIEPYVMLKSKAERLYVNSPLPRTEFAANAFYYPIQPAAVADLALTGTQLTTTWDSLNNNIDISLTVTNNGGSVAQNISVIVNNASVTNSSITFNGSAVGNWVQQTGIGQTSAVFTDYNGGREENGSQYTLWKIPQLAAGATATATFRGKAVGYENVPQNVPYYYKDLFTQSGILYADVQDNNLANNSIAVFEFKNIFYVENRILPDLTLANLTVPNPSVQQGNILNFNVDAKNIGTASATSNFNIKSYLSTDQILDASDYQNGTIPTANFAAGLTQTQVAGAMTVTNAVAAGQYYLILKIDGDNQIVESNENNNVLVSTSTITVTIPTTNTCLNRFDLEGFTPSGTDCFTGLVGGGSPNFANLQMYGNRIADGFMLNMIFNSNFSRETRLFAKTAPSNTLPANARFRDCTNTANWLYFTVSGVGRDERVDYIDENFNIRVRYWGPENNPDSIFIEMDSQQALSNTASALTFKSVRKTPNCSACFRNDVTPPAIACPTTPTVTYNDPNFENGSRLRTNLILQNTGITINETNCTTAPTTFTSINYNSIFVKGNTYPLTLVSYDSAGNKSTCNINLRFLPNDGLNNYCASKGTAPWEYAISNVSFNTLNNTSDKFKDFATLGYSDYTSLTTTLNKGQSYPLSISPGLSWIGNVPNTFCRVWIDFNNNKTFEANELVLEKTNANPLTANVLVPTTAVTGNVRMRVALKFGAYPTACEAFDRGEVEDYTINIAEGTVGGTPKLAITNVTGPTTALPGSQITLAVTVTNTGTAPTVPTSLHYAQRPISGVPFDLTYDILTIAPLAPNEVRVINYTLTLQNTIYPPNAKYIEGYSSPFVFGDYEVVANSVLNQDGTPAMSATAATFKFNIAPIFPQANISVSVVPNKTILKLGETWNAVYTIKNNSSTLIKQVFFNLGTFQRLSRNFISPNFEVAVIGGTPVNSSVKNTIGEIQSIGVDMFDLAAGESRSITLSFSRVLTPREQGSGRPQDTVATATLPFPFVNLGSNVVNTNTTVGEPIKIFVNPLIATNPPDLTLANLTVPTPSVLQGQILNFKFDLKNQGTVNATTNFNIKSYLSKDQTLSADDYQDGVVPTANLAAGVTTPQVAGAMRVSSAVVAGQYYLILKVDADNQITESNENNNVIISTGLITVTGGTTGGGADLALSIVSTPSVYRKYSVNTMRVTAQNVGNQTLTNVKVELKRPALTSNGGSKVPSLGTFQDFCPGGIECSEWTIPTLAAGASATLDAPFFVLDANAPIVVTTKLLSSIPTDANAANNTASVTISPAAAGVAASVLALSRQKPTQYMPMVVQSIEPTLTDGNVTVRVESIVEKEVSFNIYNTMGKQIFSEKRKVEKGENLLNFDVSELAQGMYLIAPESSFARNTPMKFIKF